MIKLVKVQKSNQIKEIEAELLPAYLSNGWKEYVASKVVEQSKNSGKSE